MHGIEFLILRGGGLVGLELFHIGLEAGAVGIDPGIVAGEGGHPHPHLPRLLDKGPHVGKGGLGIGRLGHAVDTQVDLADRVLLQEFQLGVGGLDGGHLPPPDAQGIRIPLLPEIDGGVLRRGGRGGRGGGRRLRGGAGGSPLPGGAASQQSGAGYGGAGQGGRQTNAFHEKPIPFHLPPR